MLNKLQKRALEGVAGLVISLTLTCSVFAKLFGHGDKLGVFSKSATDPEIVKTYQKKIRQDGIQIDQKKKIFRQQIDFLKVQRKETLSAHDLQQASALQQQMDQLLKEYRQQLSQDKDQLWFDKQMLSQERRKKERYTHTHRHP